MNSTLSIGQAKTTVAKQVGPFQEWLLSRRQAPRSIDRHLTTVERWMHNEQIENLPPSAITQKSISHWVNRDSTDAGFFTRRVDLSSLRAFCQFLCARGLMASDPSFGVKIESARPQPKRHARRSFAPAEIAALIRCAEQSDDTFWPFAIRAAQLTSMKLSEIASLEWSSFSKEPGFIVVADRRYKYASKLDAALIAIPAEHHKWVFPEQRAWMTDMKRRSYLSVQFRRLCKKAGIKGKSFRLLGHSLKPIPLG